MAREIKKANPRLGDRMIDLIYITRLDFLCRLGTAERSHLNPSTAQTDALNAETAGADTRICADTELREREAEVSIEASKH